MAPSPPRTPPPRLRRLTIYAFGLPAFVLQKVVQPAYFAREDTRTPLRFAVVSMVVNLVIAVGGAAFIGYLAAAIGTTVAGWVNLVLLWRGARRFDGAVAMDARLAARWPRILAASLVMGALVLGLAEAQAAMLPDWRVLGSGCDRGRRGRMFRRGGGDAGRIAAVGGQGRRCRAGNAVEVRRIRIDPYRGGNTPASNQPTTQPPRCACQASKPPNP